MKTLLNLALVGAMSAPLICGCEADISTVCTNNEATTEGLSTSPPDPIPGSAQMATVIGPLAPNMAKWGPDQDQPFSWPGRAIQRDIMSPMIPDEQLIYEIRLPEKTKLHKVHVWVDPVNGHAGVPATRAQAMLWTHNGGLGENNMVSSVTTMGDSTKNYEQRYLLTMSLDKPYTMKSDTRVFVYVFGEWGSNALPGLTVDTPEIVYSYDD